MSFRGKNTAETKCPYYISESEKKIRCEGFLEGMQVTLNFAGSLQKEYFQETKCRGFGEGCPIKKSVEEKYLGGQKDEGTGKIPSV